MSEIKDKLTAKQIAMQMAIKIGTGTDKVIEDYIYDAQSIYDWIVGDVLLPEIYDTTAHFDKLLEEFKRTTERTNNPTWFPIIRDENNNITSLTKSMLYCEMPVSLCSKDGKIKVIKSNEELDEIIESGEISNYIKYAKINNLDFNDTRAM